MQLTDGILVLLDAGGNAFHRAWCGFEVFHALVEQGPGYLLDIFTAQSGDYALSNNGVGIIDTLQDRSFEESKFPKHVLGRAANFELTAAKTSLPGDKTAILAAVGDDDAAVSSTFRARFGLANLQRLLRADGDNAQFTALLGWLQKSKLRRIRVIVPPSGEVSPARVERLAAAVPKSVEELRLQGQDGPSGALPPRGLNGIATLVKNGCVHRLFLVAFAKMEFAPLAAAVGAKKAQLSSLSLRCGS